MKLSVLIPTHNEQDTIGITARETYRVLKKNNVGHEILVVNDCSTDATGEVLKKLSREIPTLRHIYKPPPNGYGLAVRKGLECFSGDAVCVMMADGSDSTADLLTYYDKLRQGFDCVFGSRFIKGSRLIDYPVNKLLLNRLGNYFIKFMLGINHNDITNGFKGYRREVIRGVQPLFSKHFNLTVELPLKAIVRGYNFVTVPISWTNRAEGLSKFRIKEMGSRYLFIILYAFLEKHMAKGDYYKKNRG